MASKLNKACCTLVGVSSYEGVVGHLTAGWYLVGFTTEPQNKTWIVNLKFNNEEATVDRLVGPRFSFNRLGLKFAAFYVPALEGGISLETYGLIAPPRHIKVSFLAISSPLSMLVLLAQNLPAFLAAFAVGQEKFGARFRNSVSRAAQHGPRLKPSYSNWITWFDLWPKNRIEDWFAALGSLALPRLSVVVCYAGVASVDALNGTLASLSKQVLPAVGITVWNGGSQCDVDASGNDYIAFVQAGELLPPHALLVLTEQLVRLNHPGILIADDDQIAMDGTRYDPVLKPTPSLTLMCSGLLSRGIWLIRTQLLCDNLPATSVWAECIRLRAWLSAYQANPSSVMHRVPYILTHRSTQAEVVPPEQLALVVTEFFKTAGLDGSVTATWPLQTRWASTPLQGANVCIVVPSRLRGPLQVDCLVNILQKTNHPNVEMLIVVTQEGPLEPSQRDALVHLSRYGNVHATTLFGASFNYSAANNFGVSQSNSEFICLLNDDVSCLNGDWLGDMLAYMQDPRCGVVGPRLLYPDFRVQHGGVIVGLSGLVDHADRFQHRDNEDATGYSRFDRELSAVTGACLLIRRDVYQSLGGMDEGFPTAFNDVDLCLRVGAAGYGIVYTPNVEMIHHESLTFIRHYGPDEAKKEDADVEKFRRRWPEILLNDPFHNPNLSLKPGSERQLAFPPRVQH